MRAFCCIFYILYTFIYIGFGKGGINWGAFNMICILTSLASFAYFSSNKCIHVSKFSKMLSSYVITLTVIRIIYTLCCVFSNIEWIYSTNFIFLCISCLVLAVYVLQYCLPKNIFYYIIKLFKK